MAKIEEVIKEEGSRSSQEEWLLVHLFREGSFYRAYEQSAWLMSHYAGADLQVKKHKTKQCEDGSYVFVGFPVHSLEKFRPIGSSDVVVDVNHVVLHLPDNTFPAEVSVEILSDDFFKWKLEMAYTDVKADNGCKRDQRCPREELVEMPAGLRITDILHELLSYPLESKSPIETVLFVSDLKRRLSSLL